MRKIPGMEGISRRTPVPSQTNNGRMRSLRRTCTRVNILRSSGLDRRRRMRVAGSCALWTELTGRRGELMRYLSISPTTADARDEENLKHAELPHRQAVRPTEPPRGETKSASARRPKVFIVAVV